MNGLKLNTKERHTIETAVETFGIPEITYDTGNPAIIYLIFGTFEGYAKQGDAAVSYLVQNLPKFNYVAADLKTLRNIDEGEFYMLMTPLFLNSQWYE